VATTRRGSSMSTVFVVAQPAARISKAMNRADFLTGVPPVRWETPAI
jgi:hypothetical protein